MGFGLVDLAVTVHSSEVFSIQGNHQAALTAGAKMSALCSIPDKKVLHLNSIVYVNYVAVSGEKPLAQVFWGEIFGKS